MLLLPLALMGCKKHDVSARPVGAEVHLQPLLGLPPVPFPRENPPTAETIALGRKLFYDKHVSVDGSFILRIVS